MNLVESQVLPKVCVESIFMQPRCVRSDLRAFKRGRPSEAVKTERPGPRVPLSETRPKAELSRDEGEGLDSLN